jgi:hypothetical protein
VWWAALHLLLLAAVPCLHAPLPAAVCGVLLVAAHAVLRYPRPAPRIVRGSDGAWSVPELGLAGLKLGPRTRYTTLWVRLSLTAPRRTFELVLLVDQLEPQAWRALQVLLRRGAGTDGPRRPGSFPRGSRDLR